MLRLSPKAVILGNVTDMGLTTFIAMPFFSWYAYRAGFSITDETAFDRVSTATYGDTPTYIVLLLFGCACSVVGGYVAGNIARRGYIAHGALAGSFCFFAGIYSLMTGSSDVVWWLQVLVIPLGPALGALGAVWASRHPRTSRTNVQRKSSVVRRTVFVTLYLFGVVVFFALIGAIFLSQPCLASNRCTPGEGFLSYINAWMGTSVVIAVLWAGITGRLPGAKHQRIRVDASTDSREPVAV